MAVSFANDFNPATLFFILWQAVHYGKTRMNYLSFINNFKRKYLKYRSGSIHQFQFIFYRMSFTRLCQLIKYCWCCLLYTSDAADE